MTSSLATRKIGVPTILDENGRPLAITRRAVAAANPRGQQTYNSHPAIGLTPDILLSFYRAAELGAPVRMMDLFDDLIERDGELRGLLDEMVEDVAGWDYEVIPPPGRTDKASVIAAGELNDRVQSKTAFREFIAHQITAPQYGYAATNLVWDYEEKLAAPVEFYNCAPRRFGSPNQDTSHELWLVDAGTSMFRMVELEVGLWAVSRARGRNPYAAGQMRTCSWWSMFKLLGVKQFQVWVDMYGMPLTIGYYQEGSGEASRNALEDAVRGIGQDGYAILSDLTNVVIKDVNHGDASVHVQLIKVCDAINTKLITGGTLNTDVSSTGAGSYNAATVHKGRLDAKKRRYARMVEEMFARDIGQTFVAWNGFDRAAPPRLKIKIPWGDLDRAKTLEIIGSAMDLSASQLREEFNVRTPVAGDPKDIVRFQALQPPDPARGKSDKPS